MDSKIIEKVQKLLALSKSANENEAQSAMLKAQELLVKHKISMLDVQNHVVEDFKISDFKSNITYTKAKWKAVLAHIISENFGCYMYVRTYRTHTITFFGKDEDVTICNIVFEYALKTIDEEVKRLKKNQLLWSYSVAGIENDYSMGFNNGLRQKFEEQRKNNQEWGLVLVKEKAVVEAYNQKKFRGTVDNTTKFKGNKQAYYKGIEDGKKFSISDKVAAGSEEEILMIE